MWISRQVGKTHTQPSVQGGRATQGGSEGLEAVSTGVERGIELFSPYGYSYAVPVGTDMLLANFDGRQGVIGTVMENGKLSSGEIRLSSPSGAYILLRKDGSVVINGVEISRTGEINGK